jgi:hypothetical protein
MTEPNLKILQCGLFDCLPKTVAALAIGIVFPHSPK